MFLTTCWVVRLGVLALATLCATGPLVRAQTTLRYKFKEGEKLNYALEQKMAIEAGAGGKTFSMDMLQLVEMAWQTGAVAKDGKAKMSQKFDRLRLTMNGPNGKLEFDSRDGKLPEGQLGETVGPLLQAMTGAEFTFTMDSRGKISDVQIPQKLTEALKKSPAAALGDMFSEDGFKRMLNQSGLVLPEEAVTKDKSWDHKAELKMAFGTMKVTNLCTYQGEITRAGMKLEQVALKPTVTIDSDPNANLNIKLKAQDTKGTAYFDNAAGRLVETGVTQTLEMEVSAGGQDITQKIEQTVSMKLLDKK